MKNECIIKGFFEQVPYILPHLQKNVNTTKRKEKKIELKLYFYLSIAARCKLHISSFTDIEICKKCIPVKKKKLS